MSAIEESTDIAVIVKSNPGIVLFEADKYDDFLRSKRAEVEAFLPDLSTEKGRKAVASLAYSISQEKTRLDTAGKLAKESALQTCQKIDEARRKIAKDFDALRDQARKPLTEWETAEEIRGKHCRAIIDQLKAAAIVEASATLDHVKNLLATIQPIDVSEERFREFHREAYEAKKQAFISLTAAVARIEEDERNRAELARLRAEEEARKVAEAEAARVAEEERAKKVREAWEQAERERITKEAEERATAEAKRLADEAAKKQAAAHAAEVARLKTEQEKQEAAQRAEAARIAAAHQAELDKARKAKEDAEAKQRAEADRIAREESARKAEEARLQKVADDKAEADRKLAANKKHRQELMTATKLALIEHCGIPEAHAIAVVKMVVDGRIPNMEMKFA